MKNLSYSALPLLDSWRADQPGRGNADLIIAGRALLESADVSFGAVLGASAGAHHLSKQIYVIIRLTRHGLANLMKHGQELRSAIQIVTLDFRFLTLNR